MTLVLHKGCRFVSQKELDSIEPPAPTRTWFPLKHSVVVEAVADRLEDFGYRIKETKLGLSPDNQRFFGTLELDNRLSKQGWQQRASASSTFSDDGGLGLMVGIRNSTDKSLPIGFCAGEHVFVCDNMSFSAEVSVMRKHTRNGERRFGEALTGAVNSLTRYKEIAARRILILKETDLSEDKANSLILQSASQEIVGWRNIPKVIAEWQEPSHDEFKPRNAWSLLNCFTEILKDRQAKYPAEAAVETIKLQALLLGQHAAALANSLATAS